MSAYLLGRRVERKNLTINSGFADAPGDELSVLSTEVKYDYGFVMAIEIQNKKTSALDRTSKAYSVLLKSNYSGQPGNPQ